MCDVRFQSYGHFKNIIPTWLNLNLPDTAAQPPCSLEAASFINAPEISTGKHFTEKVLNETSLKSVEGNFIHKIILPQVLKPCFIQKTSETTKHNRTQGENITGQNNIHSIDT